MTAPVGCYAGTGRGDMLVSLLAFWRRLVSEPYRSVRKERKQTSHTFHLLMTIITAGMWGLFVWFPLTLWHKMGPKKRVVTRYR
jgi:hypothetical protein